MAWNRVRGEPTSDRNALPVKMFDPVHGSFIDWEELFSSIVVSVDVGDIELGAITLKDGDTANLAAVDSDGRLAVDVQASVLPTGAATAANQATALSSLGSILAAVTGVSTASAQSTAQATLEAIQAALEGELSVSIAGTIGTDGSTTIAAGTVAQDLFTGTTPSNGFSVYNIDPNEFLWINDDDEADEDTPGSIPIFPLGYFETPPGYRPIGPVSVWAETTGHKLTARMW